MLSKIIKNISNIPGWRTSRKIVVFEVDDWGAIRTRSKLKRDKMISNGLDLSANRFDYFDSLASSEDLESLFEVLFKYRDINNNPVVFTAVSVVANPNFDKIRHSSYEDYHYESFADTLDRYYPNQNVYELWKEGINAGIFIPEFHGREHLNVKLWMRVLHENDENVRLAFDNESVGVSSESLSNYIGGYSSAFDFEDDSCFEAQNEIIAKGLDEFEALFGYRAEQFTSSGLIHHPIIHEALKNGGVSFIDMAKQQLQPAGSGKYDKKFNKLGEVNNKRQIYITRNSRFEPNDSSKNDWVSSTLADMEIAFRWGKPAIISTHRVNFVGELDKENRANGLLDLDTLLSEMLKRWPEIEFLSAKELGSLIKQDRNVN